MIICLGLLFFHFFTGCDSTCSFFRKKTKRFWFDLWMKQQAQDNFTSVFQHLSWLPSEDILGPGLDEIEKFAMEALLTNIHAGNTINETRLSLFIFSPVTSRLDMGENPSLSSNLRLPLVGDGQFLQRNQVADGMAKT